MNTPRNEVYRAVDSERDYQDWRWGVGAEGERSTNDFALYIIRYANRLIQEDGAEDQLDTIRKITALGVACMEQHGAPLRS